MRVNARQREMGLGKIFILVKKKNHHAKVASAISHMYWKATREQMWKAEGSGSRYRKEEGKKRERNGKFYLFRFSTLDLTI